MEARPILFSAPMVQAIIAGTKTQTRRIVKECEPLAYIRYDGLHADDPLMHFWEDLNANGEPTEHYIRFEKPCPYGTVGDVLWVRENGWEPPFVTDRMLRDGADTWPDYSYDADDLYDTNNWKQFGWKRRPSIHMPRWASRITLEITDIRVERLQDISREDAIAEGLKAITKDGGITIKYGIPDKDGLPGNDNHGWHWHDWHVDPRMAYKTLWESINGAGSWDANPWVWVIQFRPHLVNVDAFIRQRGE